MARKAAEAICQNCLVVDPQTRQAVAVVNHLLQIRADAPVGDTEWQMRRRNSRESRLAPEGTRDLPGDRRLIVVCDRAGDTFEELEHEHHSGRRFVIRSRYNRPVLTGHEGSGRKQYLKSTLQRQPIAGTFQLDIAAAPG